MSTSTIQPIINRLFVASVAVFLSAWLIPILMWSPKHIEDSFQIYRMVFEAFRTISMISTASSTGIIMLYFLITGAYNWRRQYTQTTKTQTDDQLEEPSSTNEILWKAIKASKRQAAIPFSRESAQILSASEIKTFLEGIKVFEYLDSEILEALLTGSRLQTASKGSKLALKRTDMAFVTFGSFSNSIVTKDKFDGLRVTCKRGQTLTSYSNVMRSLAQYYNGPKRDIYAEISDGRFIESVALEDSQVLILEEASFVALAKKSNLAAAHLTQVILSRFKRATIPLVFDYFNLTGFASSFLGYFVKKSQGSSDVKLTELLNAFQEDRSMNGEDEKKRRVVLQYLIGTFDLDHTAFLALESSPVLLQQHIQIHEFDSNQENVQSVGAECRGAFLVLEGAMRVSFSSDSDAKFIEASVGDFVGVISSLMGKCSSIQVNLFY